MKKKKREEFDDDGRVVATMNVDGMPWDTPPGRSEGSPEELKKLNALMSSQKTWEQICIERAAAAEAMKKRG